MSDCIFCKIVAGEVPAHKVYEDDFALAFLDISPTTPGHTLVIPKEHHEKFDDIPEETLGSYMNAVQKVSKAVDAYSEGFNLLQNNGRVAGQLVFHVHFHVIPRRAGDGVSIGHWEKAQGVDMDAVQKDLQKLLS